MKLPYIIIVDDDTQVLRAIQRDIRNEYRDDYKIAATESAVEALEVIKELKLKNEEIRGLSLMSAELADVVDAGKIIEIGCQFLSKAFGEADTCFLQYLPQDNTLMITARTPAELFGAYAAPLAG